VILASRLRKHTSDDWTGSTKSTFPSAVLAAMIDERARRWAPHPKTTVWTSSPSPTGSETAFARGKRRSKG
jgi:hypothetical protein